MRKRTATIIMVLLGTVMLLVVAGVAVTAWLFVSIIDRDTATEVTATRAFDDVRHKFGGSSPLIRLGERGPIVTRRPPSAPPGHRLTTLHIMAWDGDDEKLTRAAVPFWLIRLKEDPIELSTEAAAGLAIRRPVTINVEDVERYGPSLLLDEHRGPTRVLMWTE